jgi:general secretion pathway protein J
MTKKKSGFTLLEILLAIFIFSILVTTVFSSFHMVSSATQQMNEKSTILKMGNNCLKQIALDLMEIHITDQAAHSQHDTEDWTDPNRVLGTISTVSGTSFGELQFSSLRHVSFDGSADRIAQIVYYVQKTDTNRHLLRRADRTDFEEPFEKSNRDPVLCSDVKTFQIHYYNQEKESREEWDSDSPECGRATPRAVEIRLEVETAFASDLFETVVPLPVFREKHN